MVCDLDVTQCLSCFLVETSILCSYLRYLRILRTYFIRKWFSLETVHKLSRHLKKQKNQKKTSLPEGSTVRTSQTPTIIPRSERAAGRLAARKVRCKWAPGPNECIQPAHAQTTRDQRRQICRRSEGGEGEGGEEGGGVGRGEGEVGTR